MENFKVKKLKKREDAIGELWAELPKCFLHTYITHNDAESWGQESFYNFNGNLLICI